MRNARVLGVIGCAGSASASAGANADAPCLGRERAFRWHPRSPTARTVVQAAVVTTKSHSWSSVPVFLCIIKTSSCLSHMPVTKCVKQILTSMQGPCANQGPLAFVMMSGALLVTPLKTHPRVGTLEGAVKPAAHDEGSEKYAVSRKINGIDASGLHTQDGVLVRTVGLQAQRPLCRGQVHPALGRAAGPPKPDIQ